MDWLVPKLKERGEAANARDHLFIDAGKLVPGFSLSADGAEFFCHSPFVKHYENGDFSLASPGAFERGTDGMLQAVQEASARTAEIVGYVGEWHSHPTGHSATPSRD